MAGAVHFWRTHAAIRSHRQTRTHHRLIDGHRLCPRQRTGRGRGAFGAERTQAARLEEAAETLRGDGFSVDTLAFDVTDADAALTAVDAYEAEHGAIDILVNNAGMQHRAALEEFPAEAFDTLMRTNVNSVFYVSKAVARHMIKRGTGRIINIASVQSASHVPPSRPTPRPRRRDQPDKGHGDRLGQARVEL